MIIMSCVRGVIRDDGKRADGYVTTGAPALHSDDDARRVSWCVPPVAFVGRKNPTEPSVGSQATTVTTIVDGARSVGRNTSRVRPGSGLRGTENPDRGVFSPPPETTGFAFRFSVFFFSRSADYFTARPKRPRPIGDEISKRVFGPRTVAFKPCSISLDRYESRRRERHHDSYNDSTVV